MSENSNIEWTDHTFNPWIGCTKVSPGCLNCYAETLMDTRYKRVNWGKGKPRSRTSEANWKMPLRWNRAALGAAVRPRVFCASLGDWLDEEVPQEWQNDLLRLIEATPNLDWLLLSKRPENWGAAMAPAVLDDIELAREWIDGRAPKNVWLGTSAEDQARWDERLPILNAIPAVVRFVSAEPLIGPIQMGDYRPDWLIVGGESGPGARGMSREWVESLKEQCDDRTAFFFKQWGGVNKKSTGRELFGRTFDELPAGGSPSMTVAAGA